MNDKHYGDRENQTLTEADLEAQPSKLRPIGSRSRKRRAGCPIHGSDKQRSLEIGPDGHFKCHSCEAWGYMDWAKEQFAEDRKLEKRTYASNRSLSPPVPTPPPPEPEPVRDDLQERYCGLQEALPDSPGADYLQTRKIPLQVATRYGLGYAGPGLWPGRGQEARVVFPHTTPEGTLVNLYGRTLTDSDSKHDHLSGNKGYFNAQSILQEEGPLFVCEGAFDALSLLAAGQPRAVAIFGTSGFRWDWIASVRDLVFAFDADEGGQKWKALAREAALVWGKKVGYLSSDQLGGCNDINEAWTKGVLDLSEWSGDVAKEVAFLSEDEKETWEERAAILETEAGMDRAEAEREALALLR